MGGRTLEDLVLDLALARAHHRVPEPYQSARVLRQLEPREVSQLCIQPAVERRDAAGLGLSDLCAVFHGSWSSTLPCVGLEVREVWRALLRQGPFRQMGEGFEAFVAAADTC